MIKNNMIQGIIAGLFVVVFSMVAINSLFFSKSAGDNLRADLINYKGVNERQFNIVNGKLDKLMMYVIELKHDKN